MKKGSRKWLSALLLLLLVIVLAACGGNNEPASGSTVGGKDTGATTAPAAEKTAPEPPPEVKWPTKDIKFIVPVPPGGGMDTSARLLAKYWQEAAGVNVVVENISGAEYNNGIHALLKADADGHTVILTPGVIINQLFGGVDYDMNEFDWVGRISSSAQVGAASKASGIKTFADLIAREKVKVSVTGLASSQTIGQLLSGKEFGFEVQPITHKGSSAAILSVIRGDGDFTTSPDITMLPYIENGDVVPLYVASKERLATMPDVPTLVELGFPQLLDVVAFDRILATKPGTDPAILQKLRESFEKAVKNPQFVEEYSKLGDAPNYASGEEVADNVRKNIEAIKPNVEFIKSFR